MPVNVTGSKYPIQSLSAAASYTVTIGTGTFVAGDFGATQRMVSLHSSTGAFKGIAWVRRFVSTTVLELENQFVDATGLYVAQVVGDTVLVSKNAVESAGTGFAVSSIPQQVAVTDLVTFGTAGNQTSVCFYDENMDFHTTNCMQVLGGVVVFGKLISYDGAGRGSFIWSRECNVKPRSDYSGGGAGSIAYNVFATGGTSAHMFFFGGMVGGSYRATNFIGAFSSNATNGTFAFFGTRLFYAVISPGTGGNWAANPERHLLYKTIHESNYPNASLITWGDGAFQGQSLAYPQYDAAVPLGMFRASTTAYFGADAGERMIISDLGRGSLIDGLNGGDYRFTNLITPAVTRVRGAASIPIEMRFRDEYTNLQPGSTVVVRREADEVIADSVVKTSSGKFVASVIQATYGGTTSPVPQTSNYTSFGYTVKGYGFLVVSGVHSAYTYPLGTAGSGTDLRLGGLINQVADAYVTSSEEDALALSTNVLVNPAVPELRFLANKVSTLDQGYDFTVAWGCASAANAVIPSLSRYVGIPEGEKLSLPPNWNVVIEAGATVNAGAKFRSLKLTGTGRLTNNGVITVPFEDADGLRATVSGINPEGFNVTGFIRYRKDAEDAGAWQYATYSGDTVQLLVDADVYTIEIRCPGYTAKTLTLDASESLSIDAGLQFKPAEDNSPQYEQAFDAALEAIFSYDAAAGSIKVANTTGGILQPGFNEVYRAIERIQHLPDLVWTWSDAVRVNSTSQSVIIPAGNPTAFFLSADSTATVKLTCPVIHEGTNTSADDRVKGNASGFSIILGSQASAESAGLVSQIVSALGGPNFDSSMHGLTLIEGLAQDIRAKTDKLPEQPSAVGSAMTLEAQYDAAKVASSQASVDAIQLEVTAIGSKADGIKARTDLIPDSPAAVGSAMKLEASYDAAKTAASQSSVDAVKVAIDGVKVRTDLIPDNPAAVGSAMKLEASYDAAKTAASQSSVDAVKASVDAAKARTDLIPDNPAAVGSAMKLEASYDAAKTAASQSSVDAAKAAIDGVKVRTDLIPDNPAAVGSAMKLEASYDAAKTAASQASVDALAGAVEELAANGPAENSLEVRAGLLADLTVINEGVKLASLSIPHDTSLAD